MADAIVLLTDFGGKDPYVGVMKGVILRALPGAMMVDLVHEVPPQSVLVGALHLDAAWRYFPDTSVFLCVVDPGVGTARRPVVARVGGRRFVGPDNGLFSLLPVDETRAITAPWGLPSRSATFHGRDLFAPVAARLAGGAAFEDVGPVVTPTRIEVPAPVGDEGVVLYVDHYGNAITNLPARADGVVTVGSRRIGVAGAYGDVPPGVPVVVTGSTGRLEVSVRDGSASATLGLQPGSPVSWSR